MTDRRRLIVLLVNTDPRHGAELGAPLHHAAVAAAMDYDVDVICTAAAGALMKKGVAETLRIKPDSPKTVLDFIRNAHEAGVRFLCCSANLELHGMTEADMIPECAGLVGTATFMAEIMETDARVLTY